jgi:hypothetical protein
MYTALNIYPHNFYGTGGKVTPAMVNIPQKYLKENDPDQVFARVAVDEIVIPVKHADKVRAFLKKEKINLPNL